MINIILPINKGQRLSDIYTIETNTILCKTLTGLGATYSEIKAKRHSIIELNQPPIVGKCKDPKHKKDNLFGVMQKVTVDDVIAYLEDTIANGKLIKILCTPESFYKVKQAFEYLELDMYTMCFMLLDECHKLVKDNDYREDITLPIDDFFHFDGKAMVSATPILPSDPRFEEQNFILVEVKPDYDYTKTMNIVHTNNVLEALKVTLPQIQQVQEEPRSICFFINSTDMILQLMNKLNIIEDSVVFCSTKSVDKLKRSGFNRAYDNWNDKHKMPYMFFTSRFYSALDIELNEKPDILFVTEPYFAEYTLIDPCTDAVQAIGRFRGGVSSIYHIVNTNENYPIRTKSGILEYIKASREAYTTIKRIYDCATSQESRNAFKAALDVLPFNRILKTGKIDYFAIDNYMDEALVKSSYNNIDLLMSLYGKTSHFRAEISDSLFYPLGDKERLTLENKNTSIKESRKKLVEILESLKNDMDSPIVQTHIRELRRLDPFIVEAYETVGKEVIEINNYSPKKIKEAMILKCYREKTTGVEFVQLLKNSFQVGKCYTLKYIKAELVRLYKMLDISPKDTVTAQTIREFFQVEECKHKGQKALSYLTLRKHVHNFMKYKYGMEDMPLRSLTMRFMTDFTFYLSTVLRLKVSAYNDYLILLHKMTRLALKRHILKRDPFAGHKIEKITVNHRYLTGEQFEKLLKAKLPTYRLCHTRDLFVFSTFTGIGRADLANLTEDNIITKEDGSKWIHIARQKTKAECHIKLLDIPLRIIEKYRGEGKDGKLFYVPITGNLNRSLKMIAEQCGLDCHLTYYQSRHSFATLICLNNGVPIESISKMMGHSSIRTTQIYAEITNQKVSRDLAVLSETTKGKFSLPDDGMPSRVFKCGNYSGWKKECKRNSDNEK